MPINKEEMLIETLREGFRQYLRDEYSDYKDKNAILSDAFYVSRHNIGIAFWESLKNEQNMEQCRVKLEEYFIEVPKVQNPKSNSFTYLSSMRKLKEFIDKRYGGVQAFLEKPVNGASDNVVPQNGYEVGGNNEIPRPSGSELRKYLDAWNGLESYKLQESALEKLFFRTYPNNTDIDDVLIKVSSLNDFYSTNIFSSHTIAKHIIDLNIDDRLKNEDVTLVDDIAKVRMDNGNVIVFYSFATKYCSHHKPLAFPIYDSYVDKVLRYFRDRDNFFEFKTAELRKYTKFKNILIHFSKFYGLEDYSLKGIDRYLWLLGKEKFPNTY